MATTKRSVAILVYDDVEVLDFAGPFEVFAVTSELNGHELFDVRLVAREERPVRAVNGMRVVPDFTFESSPRADIVVVAGGAGSRIAMDDRGVRDWVARASEQAEIVLSICSGARILARAGLLNGIPATTHHEVVAHVQELEPTVEMRPDARFVDSGKIVTTGGISAGIDGSFHVVERLLGPELTERTARYMEYDWRFGAVAGACFPSRGRRY